MEQIAEIKRYELNYHEEENLYKKAEKLFLSMISI